VFKTPWRGGVAERITNAFGYVPRTDDCRIESMHASVNCPVCCPFRFLEKRKEKKREEKKNEEAEAEEEKRTVSASRGGGNVGE